MAVENSEYWLKLAMMKYKEWRKRIDDPLELLSENYKNAKEGDPTLGRDVALLGVYMGIKEKREEMLEEIFRICRQIDHMDDVLLATGLTVKNIQKDIF